MPSDSRTNTLSKPHKHLRITVVGDGTTGKTCLLICYKDKRFEGYYIPTVAQVVILRSTEGAICRLKNIGVRDLDSFTMKVDEGLTDILEGLTFDSYSMTVPIGDEEYTIILSDTAGQEEYDRLRPLAYPDTDVFIVCFAVDNRASMKNVERKWVPEIRHHKPHAKIILVCTKYDLVSMTTIQRHEGEAIERKFKLDGFVECSSKEMYNVNKVFADAISTLLTPPKKAKKPKQLCALL